MLTHFIKLVFSSTFRKYKLYLANYSKTKDFYETHKTYFPFSHFIHSLSWKSTYTSLIKIKIWIKW
jgi:hypothetical protein